jgi:putative PIN family toxin of toxin-antitoxin system
VRAVVDTNILVRAVIRPLGSVRPVLDAFRAGAYQLVYSESTLGEFVSVIRRPRIQRKYGVTNEEIDDVFLAILNQGSRVVPQRQITVCCDPKDNMVLEAAVAGNADVIVSGDMDLLVLNPFEGISIVGPSAFLRMLQY